MYQSHKLDEKFGDNQRLLIFVGKLLEPTLMKHAGHRAYKKVDQRNRITVLAFCVLNGLKVHAIINFLPKLLGS